MTDVMVVVKNATTVDHPATSSVTAQSQADLDLPHALTPETEG